MKYDPKFDYVALGRQAKAIGLFYCLVRAQNNGFLGFHINLIWLLSYLLIFPFIDYLQKDDFQTPLLLLMRL